MMVLHASHTAVAFVARIAFLAPGGPRGVTVVVVFVVVSLPQTVSVGMFRALRRSQDVKGIGDEIRIPFPIAPRWFSSVIVVVVPVDAFPAGKTAADVTQGQRRRQQKGSGHQLCRSLGIRSAQPLADGCVVAVVVVVVVRSEVKGSELRGTVRRCVHGGKKITGTRSDRYNYERAGSVLQR